MSRPPFLTVFAAYPRLTPRDVLFADIGWSDLVNNQTYANTCAIRMSYALLKAGVTLPGARMKAKGGTISGRFIEPGQANLSNILKRLWGAPEVYRSEEAARTGIGKRTGVASFFQIHNGEGGGHIDLIWTAPGNRFQDCARSCYFTSQSIWFWPLR